MANATTEDDGAMRKAPIQKRSRDRVEHILGSASKLIAERGSDTMRMSEVAERSGISIGSLYQYFPDKAAIVRTLAERYNAAARLCIAEALSPVRSLDDLRTAFSDLIEQYYAIFLSEPVMRDIWCAMQADSILRAVELRESRHNAALLTQALEKAVPGIDNARIETLSLLVMSLGESAMRLAISVDAQEGRALVEAYKQMALSSFAAIDAPKDAGYRR